MYILGKKNNNGKDQAFKYEQSKEEYKCQNR